METKYILGVKGIAKYFDLSLSAAIYLIQHGGIPGVKKLKRPSFGAFPGGGRGIWVIKTVLADKYRHTRLKTPKYDPRTAVEALVNKYEYSGCKNIPELVKGGYVDEMEWCNELTRQRELSNLHVPILMHPDDLNEWFKSKGLRQIKQTELFPETTQIFKKIRVRRRLYGSR